MMIKSITKREIAALFVSILIAEGIGALSGLLSMNASDIYNGLIQPIFAPPSWIYAPVWAVLYFLMGVAAWLVWSSKAPNEDKRNALTAYFVQLLLNFIWPILFFSLNLRGLAFFELTVLLLIVVYTAIQFFEIDRRAGLLMLPYIVWLSYAMILNLTIWLLN